MGTITITSALFNPLPATPPAGWPPGVTYPGAIAPNGSRQATISDAEMVQLITWSAATWVTQGSPSAPTSPTVAQILLGWIGYVFGVTKTGIQSYFTTAPTVPPPINLN